MLRARKHRNRIGVRLRPYEDGGIVADDAPPLAETKRVDSLPTPSILKEAPPMRTLKEKIEPPDEAPEVRAPEKSDINKAIDAVIGSMPPAVRRWLRTHGDKPMTNLEVKRAPIAGPIDKALDLISLGAWSRAKKRVAYDNLFHLFLEFTVDGSRYIIEKNQLIKISKGARNAKDTESMPVADKEGLTMSEMLSKAVKRYGEDRILVYDAFGQNCQMFLNQLLAASGLLTSSLKSFIYQPIEEVAKELPGYVKKAAKAITDVGATVDRALQWLTGGRLSLKRGGLVQ